MNNLNSDRFNLLIYRNLNDKPEFKSQLEDAMFSYFKLQHLLSDHVHFVEKFDVGQFSFLLKLVAKWAEECRTTDVLKKSQGFKFDRYYMNIFSYWMKKNSRMLNLKSATKEESKEFIGTELGLKQISYGYQFEIFKILKSIYRDVDEMDLLYSCVESGRIIGELETNFVLRN